MITLNRPLATGLLTLFVAFAPVRAAVAKIEYPKKELSQALKKFKDNLSSFDKGRELYANGDLAGAARSFQRCVQALPEHIYAHYYLANILYIRQDYDGSLSSIEKAEGAIEFMIAVDAFARREKIKALSDAKKAIADYWDTTSSCRESRELEKIYGRVEDEEKSAEMQDSLEELRWRVLKSEYAYFHGNVLFQLKEYDLAAERYQRAIRENPQNGNAYNNLAAIQYFGRRFVEAERLFRMAEEAGVGDMINLKLKKFIFEALGKPTEGILEQEYPAGGDERIQTVRFTGNVYEGDPGRLHLFAHGYLVYDRESGDALLIDPGRMDPRIEEYVKEKNLNVRGILNTHGHYDHTHANVRYADMFGAPIAAHSQEAPLYAEDPDGQCGRPGMLIEETSVRFGTIALEVWHTPGHTPGSVCFHVGAFLFSGDSLFPDSIGRINAAGEDEYREKRERLINGLIRMVRKLPAETLILPGHGPTCTLIRAREINPALRTS